MAWTIWITWWITWITWLSISDIQDYSDIEYIFEKHGKKTVNSSMKIYINRIENRITFEVKTRYYLELLTPETLKLLGSTKSKITKDENGKNVHYIEITEVVLIHCNVVNNSYHQNSRVFTAQKKKFSIKDFFSKCDQILNGKLHFLCSACIHLFLVKHLDIY